MTYPIPLFYTRLYRVRNPSAIPDTLYKGWRSGLLPGSGLTADSVIQNQSGPCLGSSFSSLAFLLRPFWDIAYTFLRRWACLASLSYLFYPLPLGMLPQFGKSAVIMMANVSVGLAQAHCNLLKGVPLVETQT